VGVAVDQPRQERGAAPVDHLPPRADGELAADPDGGDATLGDQDVAVVLDATRLDVEHGDALNENGVGTRFGPAHQLRRSGPAGQAQERQSHMAPQGPLLFAVPRASIPGFLHTHLPELRAARNDPERPSTGGSEGPRRAGTRSSRQATARTGW
jgi:hypothetical protein